MKFLLTNLAFLILVVGLQAHGVCVADADNSRYLKLERSKIDVAVNNQIATVTSVQTFYNDGCDDVKVKYAFPLPVGANPIYFRYRLEGGDWQEAVFNSAGQDTSLPGAGNIGGGGGNSNGTATEGLNDYLGAAPFFFTFKNQVPQDNTIEIEIIYVQLLSYDFGIVQFHYPNDYSAVQSNIELIQFNMELNSGREISTFESFGPEGELVQMPFYATLIFADENAALDSDIIVNYALVSDELGSYTMSTMLPDTAVICDNFGGGFLTMILEPESNEDTEVIEKNFCLVIDRSGSMTRGKMDEAKSAANFIVNNLNEGDYFNVVDFSNSVRSFRDEMVVVDADNVAAAETYITALNSGGTTNISGSLTEAIGNFGGLDTTKANIIIFFTDGLPTAGIESPDGIIEVIDDQVAVLETGIFLFTFGIGEDVNQALLTTLALENNGLATFLQDDELEEEITDFFLKINNPVLINTKLTISPDVIRELYPDPVPNLYKGQQLILSGRYQEAVPVEMTLKGQFYNSVVEYTFNIDLSDTLDPQLSILPQIWAKQKIDDLAIDFILSTSNSEKDVIQAEIDSLGSCYGVVNVAFNSFSDGVLEIDFQDLRLFELADNTVLIRWSTTAEINNKAFIVQRSCDGEVWEDIHEESGQLDSYETINYEYLDKDPCVGINYYRIVTVDLYGELSYSHIEAIMIDQAEEVALFPNPVKSGDNIYIDSQLESELQVKIFSVDGQLITETKVLGTDSIQLLGYEAGIYLCVLSSGDFRKVVQVIVQ